MENILVCKLVLFVSLLAIDVHGQILGSDWEEVDWCYERESCGPNSWTGQCQRGKRQSPINLIATRTRESIGITFEGGCLLPKSFFLHNVGDTVELSLAPRNNNNPSSDLCSIKGVDSQRNSYTFSQLHFHWGRDDLGSGHHISGISYPLEMHIVLKTMDSRERTAVIAVFFEITPTDNHDLYPLVNSLLRIRYPTLSPIEINPNVRISLISLMPKELGLFRYSGSLTTPPCTENINWTVFEKPLAISKRQLDTFKMFLAHDLNPMSENFRPLQAIGNRQVVYFKNVKMSGNLRNFNSL